jgi:hypothetical protein
LTSLILASAAGFILNGGANSRMGRTIAGFVGPIALRSAVTSVLLRMVSANVDERKSSLTKKGKHYAAR